MTNDYIQDQLLEIYLDEMDNIIETATEEATEFFNITEANELVVKKNEVGPNNNAGNTKGGKIKEMLNKLSELLKKFVAALERVGGILKEKAMKVAELVANKFKVAGKVKEETKCVKFDLMLRNVDAINEIINKVDSEIINPIESNQNPKNDDIGIYDSDFEPLMYNNFIKNENNFVTYKPGAIIRENLFVNSDKIVQTSESSRTRNKQYLSRLNTVMPTVERDENASDNAKILYRGLQAAIKYHQNMMKYNTKCVGDELNLIKNSEKLNKAG